MKIVNTTAPIQIEDLKKYFSDNEVVFFIDYKNSSLKGKKLLIYLGNLDIPCDINFENSNNEEINEIISEYLNLPSLVNIPILEKITIQLLFEKKNIFLEKNKELIEKNNVILNEWI